MHLPRPGCPHDRRGRPSRRPSSAVVQDPLRSGADRDRARHPDRAFLSEYRQALKPLGDGFIALIKMMIAPVIFCTVVHGISSMGDLKRVGRVGLKALIYFEVVSTVALAIGLIVGEVLQPGAGFNIDPASIDPKSVSTYVTK